jgi:hypothetical protein
MSASRLALLFSLSPLFAGRGWDEGLLPQIVKLKYAR